MLSVIRYSRIFIMIDYDSKNVSELSTRHVDLIYACKTREYSEKISFEFTRLDQYLKTFISADIKSLSHSIAWKINVASSVYRKENSRFFNDVQSTSLCRLF